MTVRYHQRRGGTAAAHLPLPARRHLQRRRICAAVPGAALDEQSGSCSSTPSRPLAVEAALPVAAELRHRAAEADALRAAHVERARYHADLARRRYLAVDPANRLSPTPSTPDWNTALRALTDAQDRLRPRPRAAHGQLTDTQKTRIPSSSPTCPAIWNDPRHPGPRRKRIARLLLTDITVTRTGDTITAHVRLPAASHAPSPCRSPQPPGDPAGARHPATITASTSCSTTTPTPRSPASSTTAA